MELQNPIDEYLKSTTTSENLSFKTSITASKKPITSGFFNQPSTISWLQKKEEGKGVEEKQASPFMSIIPKQNTGGMFSAFNKSQTNPILSSFGNTGGGFFRDVAKDDKEEKLSISQEMKKSQNNTNSFGFGFNLKGASTNGFFNQEKINLNNPDSKTIGRFGSGIKSVSKKHETPKKKELDTTFKLVQDQPAEKEIEKAHQDEYTTPKKEMTFEHNYKFKSSTRKPHDDTNVKERARRVDDILNEITNSIELFAAENQPNQNTIPITQQEENTHRELLSEVAKDPTSRLERMISFGPIKKQQDMPEVYEMLSPSLKNTQENNIHEVVKEPDPSLLNKSERNIQNIKKSEDICEIQEGPAPTLERTISFGPAKVYQPEEAPNVGFESFVAPSLDNLPSLPLVQSIPSNALSYPSPRQVSSPCSSKLSAVKELILEESFILDEGLRIAPERDLSTPLSPPIKHPQNKDLNLPTPRSNLNREEVCLTEEKMVKRAGKAESLGERREEEDDEVEIHNGEDKGFTFPLIRDTHENEEITRDPCETQNKQRSFSDGDLDKVDYKPFKSQKTEFLESNPSLFELANKMNSLLNQPMLKDQQEQIRVQRSNVLEMRLSIAKIQVPENIFSENLNVCKKLNISSENVLLQVLKLSTELYAQKEKYLYYISPFNLKEIQKEEFKLNKYFNSMLINIKFINAYSDMNSVYNSSIYQKLPKLKNPSKIKENLSFAMLKLNRPSKLARSFRNPSSRLNSALLDDCNQDLPCYTSKDKIRKQKSSFYGNIQSSIDMEVREELPDIDLMLHTQISFGSDPKERDFIVNQSRSFNEQPLISREAITTKWMHYFKDFYLERLQIVEKIVHSLEVDINTKFAYRVDVEKKLTQTNKQFKGYGIDLNFFND